MRAFKYSLIILFLVIYLFSLFCFDIVASNVYYPNSAIGQSSIIMGSSNLSPDIKMYSICWLQTKDVYQSIQEGDYITYDGFYGNEVVTICNKVQSVGEGYVTTVEGESGNSSSVRLIDVTGRVVSTWNLVAPLVAVLLSTPGQIMLIMSTIAFIAGLIYSIVKAIRNLLVKKRLKVVMG